MQLHEEELCCMLDFKYKTYTNWENLIMSHYTCRILKMTWNKNCPIVVTVCLLFFLSLLPFFCLLQLFFLSIAIHSRTFIGKWIIMIICFFPTTMSIFFFFESFSQKKLVTWRNLGMFNKRNWICLLNIRCWLVSCRWERDWVC